MFHPVSARRALGGFFLAGFLTALPGAMLPAWGHHLKLQHFTAGHYFLSLAGGVAISMQINRRLLDRYGIGTVLVLACGVAVFALLAFSAVPPPASPYWRIVCFAVLGFSIGVLNSSLFHAIAPAYRHDAAATANLGGLFFGLGCLTMTVLVAGAFYAYPVAAILWLAALVPALCAMMYRRTKFGTAEPAGPGLLRQALRDVRRPATLLLALLLFFQFGNEWVVAGWLAIFLATRLGVSPETSLWMLAIYWLVLLTGRLCAIAMLPRLPHGRLLAASAAAALFGCIILMSTGNLFGASTGILLVGLAYSVIYPLVAEKIGHRYTDYHPGLFYGIFSLAVIGAMTAPALAAYLAGGWNINMMALPMVGTALVVVFLSLIWLESKVGG